MHMKTRIIILIAIVSMMVCSCSKGFQDIAVTSFDVVSLKPVGLSRLEATVELGIHNPATELHISDLMGTLKYQGAPCLSITSDDVVIEKKSDKLYTVVLNGTIDPDFEIIRLIKLMKSDSLDEMTVDVSCHGALRSGLGKDIGKKDIPLKDLISKL